MKNSFLLFPFLAMITCLATALVVAENAGAEVAPPYFGMSSARAIAVDSARNVYVTGNSVTIKYGPTGKVRWVTPYMGNGMAIDQAGNVHVAGTDKYSDYRLVKLNPKGKVLWEKGYYGPLDSINEPSAIAVDSAGNVYVMGISSGNYATLKYDSDGKLLWEKRFEVTRYGSTGPALALDKSGNVYVAGESVGESTGTDYATLKYDGSGNLLWVRYYNGPYDEQDSPTALAVDVQGNVYVTGYSNAGTRRAGDTYMDYATLKYDTDGNLLWERRYNGNVNSFDVPLALAVDGSGNVYVTGEVHQKNVYDDYATLKYDASGELLWARKYNGPGNGSDVGQALTLDPAGNVYVTGYSSSGIAESGGTGFDYLTIKYNADGKRLWAKRYNGYSDGGDGASAIAVDTAGNVYVTGYSESPISSAFPYATIKYNANGKCLWVKRHGDF